MAITPKINSNFENVGSIRVVSAGGSVTGRSFTQTTQESSNQNALLFGGYGYSANVNVNDGNGYEITINVISADGVYTISEKDLNATSAGAKNIQIGNFVFYDFFLTSYSIQKEVESSILVLTYKDKSIFMDKLYIGLLHYEHGIRLTNSNNIVQEVKPTSIISSPQAVQFNYLCDKNKPESQTTISLGRDLYTVFTARDPKEFITKLQNTQDYINKTLVDSSYFYSQYDYQKDGVNGGYIILGSEEFKEATCEIRDVSYTFKDLLSSLFYSNVPGIEFLKMPSNNTIFKRLRKNYFGSLRSVLSNWATDLGMRFYYQPKIQYKTRDYSDLKLSPSEFITIPEGVKYLDVNSGPQTLKNLNAFLASSDGKILKKVVQSISETATLEGTVKSSVITSIRRGARFFPKTVESFFSGEAKPLSLSNIPSFYGVDTTGDDFLIRATLGKYDGDLRDIYTIFTNNLTPLGISNPRYLFGGPQNVDLIKNKVDFLASFGPDVGKPISDTLNNYICFIAQYDAEKHEAIKQWEKEIIENFYNQFYEITFSTDQQQYCAQDYNYSIQYETEPPSQRYSANELPFKNLLYSKSALNLISNSSTYSKKKTNPLFKVENPFSDSNESEFKAYVEKFGTDGFGNKKTIKIIDLGSNAIARAALSVAINPSENDYVYINQKNMFIFLCPRFNNVSGLGSVTLANGLNTSILYNDDFPQTTSKSNCPKTVCEQSVDDLGCNSGNTQAKISFYTGFVKNNQPNAKVVQITKDSITYNLILPCINNYRYLVTKRVDSTTTFPAKNYVLGSLPKYPSDPKSPERLDYNVLSYSSVRNPVPEILTQIESSAGVQDQIVTFTDSNGQRAIVSDALSFHYSMANQINNSVTTPHQTKTLSLTSTYIPTQLKSYIFDNPILASMSFSLGNDGFNTTFNFQSRQKEVKPLDSIYETQQFLSVL